MRVEDHGLQRRVGISRRRRDTLYDGVEQLFDSLAGFGADPQHVQGVQAERLFHFVGDFVGPRVLEVDFVDYAQDR